MWIVHFLILLFPNNSKTIIINVSDHAYGGFIIHCFQCFFRFFEILSEPETSTECSLFTIQGESPGIATPSMGYGKCLIRRNLKRAPQNPYRKWLSA